MKHILAMTLLCAATLTSQAANADSSRASDNASMASAIVLVGSIVVLASAGEVVIDTVETVADGTANGASKAATASVKLGKQATQGLSLAAGTVIQVVAVSTGHMLVLSGKAIAYVPNAAGNAILHHSKA